MNLIKKFKNWRSVENPAPLTLRNIWAVLQSYFRRSVKIPKYIQEQKDFRETQVDPVCKAQGFCRLCGCDLEGKLFEDRACDGFCYPDMMTKEVWKEYKKAFKIKN